MPKKREKGTNETFWNPGSLVGPIVRVVCPNIFPSIVFTLYLSIVGIVSALGNKSCAEIIQMENTLFWSFMSIWFLSQFFSQDLINMTIQRIYKEIEISEDAVTSFLTSEKVVFLSTVIWPGMLKSYLLNSCCVHNKEEKVVAWIVNSVGVVLEFTLKENMAWRNPSITQSAFLTNSPFPTWERCPCFPWRDSQRCTRWSQDRSPDDHWRNTELPE